MPRKNGHLSIVEIRSKLHDHYGEFQKLIAENNFNNPTVVNLGKLLLKYWSCLYELNDADKRQIAIGFNEYLIAEITTIFQKKFKVDARQDCVKKIALHLTSHTMPQTIRDTLAQRMFADMLAWEVSDATRWTVPTFVQQQNYIFYTFLNFSFLAFNNRLNYRRYVKLLDLMGERFVRSRLSIVKMLYDQESTYLQVQDSFNMKRSKDMYQFLGFLIVALFLTYASIIAYLQEKIDWQPIVIIFGCSLLLLTIISCSDIIKGSWRQLFGRYFKANHSPIFDIPAYVNYAISTLQLTNIDKIDQPSPPIQATQQGIQKTSIPPAHLQTSHNPDYVDSNFLPPASSARTFYRNALHSTPDRTPTIPSISKKLHWQTPEGLSLDFDSDMYHPQIIQLYSNQLSWIGDFHFIYWEPSAVTKILGRRQDLYRVFHNLAVRRHVVARINNQGFIYEEDHFIIKQLTHNGSHNRLHFDHYLIADDGRTRLHFPTRLTNQ